LISNLESYAQELEDKAHALEAEDVPPLSSTAMQATSEPSGIQAVAALRTEDAKEPSEE
jgi:hypothetical protein